MKSDHLRLTIDIFDKRYRIGDFNGQVLAEVSAVKHVKPPSYLSSITNQSHRPGEKQKVSYIESSLNYRCSNSSFTGINRITKEEGLQEKAKECRTRSKEGTSRSS
jgi:hypothetical protein